MLDRRVRIGQRRTLPGIPQKETGLTRPDEDVLTGRQPQFSMTLAGDFGLEDLVTQQ